MAIDNFVRQIPIDDVVSLLNFYYDYIRRKEEVHEYIDMTQKDSKLNFYFNGKKYSLYSDNAVYIYSLITKKEHEPALLQKMGEIIKEIFVGKGTNRNGLLSEIIKELSNRAENFKHEIYLQFY